MVEKNYFVVMVTSKRTVMFAFELDRDQEMFVRLLNENSIAIAMLVERPGNVNSFEWELREDIPRFGKRWSTTIIKPYELPVIENKETELERLDGEFNKGAIDLDRFPPDPEAIMWASTNFITRNVAKGNILLPVRFREGDILIVGTTDPINHVNAEDLRMRTGYRIELRPCLEDQLMPWIEEFYGKVEI